MATRLRQLESKQKEFADMVTFLKQPSEFLWNVDAVEFFPGEGKFGEFEVCVPGEKKGACAARLGAMVILGRQALPQ